MFLNFIGFVSNAFSCLLRRAFSFKVYTIRYRVSNKLLSYEKFKINLFLFTMCVGVCVCVCVGQ